MKIKLLTHFCISSLFTKRSKEKSGLYSTYSAMWTIRKALWWL